MVQPPVAGMGAQVPALLPEAMAQLPLQHSLPEKQTSPSGWQPAAVVMQAPPWQLCEQHCPSSVQLLLSVVQPVGFTGLQVLASQLPPQHSASLVQALPSCTQAAPQWPETQLRPQHSMGEAQVAPMAAHEPP